MQNLNFRIVERLKNQFGFVEAGDHLRKGKCPDCNKLTLWTWLATPGVVQCNRTNHCNFSATTKELLPDLYENLNKRYPATVEKPNQTAEAYLQLVRGFDVAKIAGWFEQGKFWHPHGDRGTATVRFFLDDAKSIMWERLIDDVTITEENGDIEVRNKNFRGAFRGLWWMPPGMDIVRGDSVYLCEGILDAIALYLNGFKAVAIMSSGTFPDVSIAPFLNMEVKWVFALDNDVSGRRFLQKHTIRLRDMGERVKAAITSEIEEKTDWNDLHKIRQLTDEHMRFYRYLGRIELATNHIERARVMWKHEPKKTFFVFTFGNTTFSFKINPDEFAKALEKESDIHPERALRNEDVAFVHSSKIKPIATFRMDFLYFQQPDNGEDGQYFFRFNFSNHAPEVQLPFFGKIFGAAGDFKKGALLKAPGAQFTGSTGDLDFMYKQWMGRIPKIITTLDYVGYDRQTKAYVYGDFAVQDGKIIKLNKESFFQLKQSGIKTAVDIKQRLTVKPAVDWLPDYLMAFGTGGMVALSWWFGCLFVEQVRQHYRSYPFLEVVGEAGSGKSDMVDFLWKLLGKEGESFNPNSSTMAGRTRKMAEVSNLPVVFNETDNEQLDDRHQKRFNWDEQKDLFDGEFGRVTGVKSHDNSTKKPSFKSGLMIVQNVPVVASEAIMTRIVHLLFDRSHHSLQGKYASDRLNMLNVEDVSGFLLHSVKMADRVMAAFDVAFKKHRVALQGNDKIKLQRIVENHAKIMAFSDCLKLVLPVSDAVILQTQAKLVAMAEERQASLQEDHPIVQQFWALFDYLNSKPVIGSDDITPPSGASHVMNHANDPDAVICVNLEHFRQRCSDQRLETMDSKELRRWLPTSRKRQYLGNDVIRSRLENRSIRCWRFKN